MPSLQIALTKLGATARYSPSQDWTGRLGGRMAVGVLYGAVGRCEGHFES